MSNTSRSFMMSQIAELVFYGVIPKSEEGKYVDKINELWDRWGKTERARAKALSSSNEQ